MLRFESRNPPGTTRQLRLWLLAFFLSTYPLLLGAWLASSGSEARFVIVLIGVSSLLSIVNLIVVPWALIQDRRIEIGPEGIDVMAKIRPPRLPWSSVLWVRVKGGRLPQKTAAFWIGGRLRRCIVWVNPGQHPESLSRLRSAVARYAPQAKRSGQMSDTVWDPNGSVEGEFVSIESRWGRLWILFSFVVALAAVNFQAALIIGPAIVPSSTIRGAVILAYFVMAAGFVSTGNRMLRVATSRADALTFPRGRTLSQLGGASLVAVSAVMTIASLV
jgi:hypothetical protein